jgi:hypothetical protein
MHRRPSSAAPAILAIHNGAIVLQGSGWSGSFPPGTFAFYKQGNGDCVIQFGSPVMGFGTTLDDGSQQSFSGLIEPFAGATSLGQFPASTTAHTVLYLGVSDTESCEAAGLGLLALVALRRRA